MKKDPIKLMDFEFINKYKPALDKNGELARFDHLPDDTEPQRIWTMNESENSYYIANGVHPVGFIAFVVTEVPCAEDETVVVAWDVRGEINDSLENSWDVLCPGCKSNSKLSAAVATSVRLKPHMEHTEVFGSGEIDEEKPIFCDCGKCFSWAEGRAAFAKAQDDADMLALADFLYDDEEWRLAVANDETRLGRNDWKVHQTCERMEADD